MLKFLAKISVHLILPRKTLGFLPWVICCLKHLNKTMPHCFLAPSLKSHPCVKFSTRFFPYSFFTIILGSFICGQLTDILRCPVIKFVGYIVSYVTFLILITVATFRLDRSYLSEEDDDWELRSSEIWSYDFRTSNLVMTKIQIILLFWILGESQRIVLHCTLLHNKDQFLLLLIDRCTS